MTAPNSSLGPNVPQAFAAPQVTVHVTAILPPTVPLGYVVAATRVDAAFTASDVGGVETNTTERGDAGPGAASLPEPPHPDSSTTINAGTMRCLKLGRMRCVMGFVRAQVSSVCDSS